MRFEPLALGGAWLIHQERLSDERGFFARTICIDEFAAHGIDGRFVQSSVSYNRLRGTFRGMHFQWPPFGESKLVRCTAGAIHDVLLDLRPESSTFLAHVAVQLAAASGASVYIPTGLAHGFQTLTDGAEVQYHMTEKFRPETGGGFRWNDPAFSISLPLPVAAISDRDSRYPAFDRNAFMTKWGS